MESPFAHARALEADGRFDEAFDAFSAANIERRGGRSLAEEDAFREDVLKFVRSLYSAEFLAQWRTTDHTQSPIFIVGLPRSGSSLVEQILACHPEIAAFGETQLLGPAMAPAFPRAPFQTPPPNFIERTRERYLDALQVKTSQRFTDKTLWNYTRVGMINLVFPNAIILNCVRDPIDTCWSGYTTAFAEVPVYTTDLGALGRQYVRYRKIMAHWQSVLFGAVIDFSYESLVAEPEARTRQLLSLCNLSWNDQCLRFYENPREVVTASRDQVRRPIFTESIGRSRMYEKHLGPLLDALGPYANPS